MQFPSHWEAISPGDLIKKPVLEQFTAQIYRSKKWGWFRLTFYKHLLSRVLLQTKPEPEFFSPGQLPFYTDWVMWRGWKTATTACWEFPQLWGSLPAVLNHWNLFLHFDCRGRTSSTPESSAKPWLAPSTWPTLIAAGVSTVGLVNPSELSNGEYAKVAEGGVWSFFDWCRVFFIVGCFFFLLGQGEKKNTTQSEEKIFGLHFM